MNAKDTVNLAILAAVGFGLYKLLNKLPQVTAPLSAGIANLWVSLTGQPPMIVLGSVVFPDGNTAALSSLEVRADASGSAFVKYAGHVYQLQPSDANGNWPAVLVA